MTNNDVSEADAKRLNKAGHFAGDPDFEAEEIFESVTRPRVEAAITGVKPDGEPVEGAYLDQYLSDHNYADGFEENIAYFRMDYLEPDLVELGRQYNAIVPLLWMAAGSVGCWEEWNVPYEQKGRWLPMYPDFLFLRKVGDKVVVDILDPHDPTRSDAVPKAKGLARYAEHHGARFGRIQVIAKVGGAMRRLELNDPKVRKALAVVDSSDALVHLYETSGLAV